ncbi:hypothetical protein GCM10022420_094600 [Streptomyces iranensis]
MIVAVGRTGRTTAALAGALDTTGAREIRRVEHGRAVHQPVVARDSYLCPTVQTARRVADDGPGSAGFDLRKRSQGSRDPETGIRHSVFSRSGPDGLVPSGPAEYLVRLSPGAWAT